MFYAIPNYAHSTYNISRENVNITLMIHSLRDTIDCGKFTILGYSWHGALR